MGGCSGGGGGHGSVAALGDDCGRVDGDNIAHGITFLEEAARFRIFVYITKTADIIRAVLQLGTQPDTQPTAYLVGTSMMPVSTV